MNMDKIQEYLDYEGLTLYHKGITGKIYIPTLDYIPSTETLYYVKDNEIFNFEIGDFARVIDETRECGYKFYQLYDITENNEAIWDTYAQTTAPVFTPP